jgi:hypothetical protein
MLRFPTAMLLGVVLAGMCGIAPAYGVQEVTLRELPPLQPLHWCKHSDGGVLPQREPCGSDTTEVSSVTERRPDGTVAYLPLEKPATTDGKPAASESASRADQSTGVVPNPSPVEFWKRMARWLGFAAVVGLWAKLFKRSFMVGLILGFVLRAVLVALNVMAF